MIVLLYSTSPIRGFPDPTPSSAGLPTMPTRSHRPSLALLCLTLVPHPIEATARAPLDRPNVVVFFVDDLGYGDGLCVPDSHGHHPPCRPRFSLNRRARCTSHGQRLLTVGSLSLATQLASTATRPSRRPTSTPWRGLGKCSRRGTAHVPCAPAHARRCSRDGSGRGLASRASCRPSRIRASLSMKPRWPTSSSSLDMRRPYVASAWGALP